MNALRLIAVTAAAWAAPPVLGFDEAPGVPAGAPGGVVDLGTAEGTELVRGGWRYHEARLVEVDFAAPGSDGKPGGPPQRTWDISPRAGAADFDDSAWETIDPATLSQRRSTGKVCFNWYRINVTVPERVGSFETAGSTCVFEIVVDDYAEVWVDGKLPRDLGQSGGSVVAGFNVPNRLVIGRDVRPGRRVQIAVFGMNGPISDAPPNYIWIRSAKLEFHRPPAPVSGSAMGAAPSMARLDPRLDAIIPAGTEITKVAGGFEWVEGPVWDRAAACLYFSDIPRNSVFRWREGGNAELFLKPSGYTGSVPFRGREPGSNGLALDATGRLVLCQHGDRRIARREADGALTVLADRYQGRRLNSPNDAVFRRGELWFTDPPFGLERAFDDPARELPFCGVYRAPAGGGDPVLVVADLPAPNGIAFSPDGGTLYVSNADARRPVLMEYELSEDGTAGPGRVLFDATPWVGRYAGVPDGIKTDARGNLFAAGPGGIYILSAEGAHLGTIVLGVATSNCAFGGGDGSVLYITAGDAVYAVATTTRG